MKYYILLSSILISIGLTLCGYFISTTHKKALEHANTVTVKGLAEREVEADLAVWPFEISIAGNDLPTLRQQLSTQKEQVLAYFKDFGFKDEEIQAGINNILDRNTLNYNASFVQRYIAKSSFTLRSTAIEKIREAQRKSIELLSQGIVMNSTNNWKPVNYTFNNLNKLKPEMIEEATKNARSVAQKFAEDAQTEVGKIKSARQGVFTINDRDQNTQEIKKIRVVTTITYYLR